MVLIKKEISDFDLINNEYDVIRETVEQIFSAMKFNKVVKEIVFFMSDGRRYTLKNNLDKVTFKKYRTIIEYQGKVCILKNSDIISIDLKFEGLWSHKVRAGLHNQLTSMPVC